jgi:hypothetical protein
MEKDPMPINWKPSRCLVQNQLFERPSTRIVLKGALLGIAFLFLLLGTADAARTTQQADGDGSVRISGELKQWHKVSLTLDGPFAQESDGTLNPFTDYRMDVSFRHESGSPSYTVPGYFAADGRAGNSSADKGNKWRAHLSPDKAGTWSYQVSFFQGNDVAIRSQAGGKAMERYSGAKGRFVIGATDKSARDFRHHGRLQYVGKHHLQFAGSRAY